MTVEKIKLKCDQCSGSLTGDNNSVVFFCLKCGRALDISGDTPVFYRMKFAVPARQHEMPMEYFPFWYLRYRYSVEDTNEGTLDSGERKFLIPSFFIKNINYFGDLGIYYMQRDVVPEFGEWMDIPVFPADRGLTDASHYPYIYLMSEYSKKRGTESTKVDMKRTGEGFVLIPFYKKGHAYYDSLIFWKYPSGALI